MAGSDAAHAGRRAGGLSLVRCGKRTNFGGGLGEREAKRSLPQLARVGSADLSFPENTGKPKKSAASIYGGWFRVLSGGSMWLSALPTGGSRWSRALPGYFRRRPSEKASPTFSPRTR